MKKFVIVGTQRSGTTYIRHCLNSHPDILCHGELFLENYPDEAGYFEYIKRVPVGLARHWLLRPLLVNEFLQRYYQQTGFKAVGFKLMYSQIRWVPYKYPTVLNYIRKHSVSVVHIVRENLLKTLVSREVARKRKMFHAKSKVAIEKVHIEQNSLIPELNKIKRENEWWARHLSGENYLDIVYEKFVANKEAESRRMLDFLSIDHYRELGSPNVKITPDDLRDVVENYDDIVRLLENTEFSYCLY